eukprot:jgi/Tetstr1/425566/TSEL_015989.t1
MAVGTAGVTYASELSAHRGKHDVSARRAVDSIFRAADRNGDGKLNQTELRDLMLALNPAMEISFEQAQQLVQLVLQRYSAFVTSDDCLSSAGFQQSYEDGAGDPMRDLHMLGLALAEDADAARSVVPLEGSDCEAVLQATVRPEPAPEMHRESEGGGTPLTAAAKVASIYPLERKEPSRTAGPNDEPQRDDIPGLVALIAYCNIDDTSAEISPLDLITASLDMLCHLTWDSHESREEVRRAGGLDVLAQYLSVQDLRNEALRNACTKATVLVTNLAIGSPANQAGLRQAGVVQTLVDTLKRLVQHGHAGHQLTERIVVALWSLAYNHPSNKLAIGEAGAIPALVAILDPQESSPAVASKAGLAVWCLVRELEENQNAVREAGGITVLCLLIRRFVSDDGHSSTGGVSMAHGAYSSSSIVSSSLATVALSVLQTLTSSNHENGQAVRLAGGILPIVQLLRRGPQGDLTWLAAAVLWTVALDNSDNQDAIREAGGVTYLVTLLQSTACQSTCLHNCLGALRMLAVDNDINCNAIRLAGGVRTLVRMLQDANGERGDVTAQCLTAAALADLAAGNEANQTAILQEGGAHVLLKKLSMTRHLRLTDHLTGALFELSHNNPSAAAAVAEQRVIPHLIELLSQEHMPNRVKEKLAGILCGLANVGRAYQDDIRRAGGIHVLSHILMTGDPHEAATQNAVAALCNLAHGNEHNRDAIRNTRCIPQLVHFLDVSDALACKEKAVGALCNLAYVSPPNKEEIGATGAIPILVGILERAIARDQNAAFHGLAERVVGALCTLAYHNSPNQAMIRQAGGVKVLKKLRHFKLGSRTLAARAKVALANLSEEHGHRRRSSSGGSSFDLLNDTRRGSEGSAPMFASPRTLILNSPRTLMSPRSALPPTSPRYANPGGPFSANWTPAFPHRSNGVDVRQGTVDAGSHAAPGDTKGPSTHSPRSEGAMGGLKDKISRTFSKLSPRTGSANSAESTPTLREVTEATQLSPRSAVRAYFNV